MIRIEAMMALAKLYASSRPYIIFFQPSFKLKSKTQGGVYLHKLYLAPATPFDGLQAHGSEPPATKEKKQAKLNRQECQSAQPGS